MRDYPLRITVSLILAASFYLMVMLYPVWSRILPGVGNTIILLLGFGLVLTLVGLLVFSFIILFFNKNYKKIESYLPILLIPLTFYISFFAPFKVDLDKLYGEVTYQACYEGTMNQATLKLRGKNKIEIRWTGAFFSDDFFIGSYKQNNDTLYFDFENGERPRNFGNKAILNVGEGITWYNNENELIDRPFFYEGKCKGLN